MTTWAVIMAGGAGTRFWPLSRRRRPKQLLPLAGGDSLIRATVARLRACAIPHERILVVTNEALVEPTAAELPEIPRPNILGEPVGRNTAPCIAWAASRARRHDPDAVLAVLPADHHVDPHGFADVVSRALVAATSSDAIVTVGIVPTRPETGYGYIEVGEKIETGLFRVARFVEKPDLERAQEFLAAGTFLWNSGMFFFRAEVMQDEIARSLPDLARFAGSDDEAIRAMFPTVKGISIDHGVMEKARRILVATTDMAWSDVGSWTTSWELADKDASGNALPEGAVPIDARGNYVRAPDGKLVALIGVEDLVIVDTGDALLVVPRERAQDVREVVAALEARKDEEHR